MKLVVFVSMLLLCSTLSVTAQQAVFVADSSQPWMKYAAKDVAEYEWRIQGKTLRFGSEPITADVNLNVVDTVFFRSHTRFQWDTLLCIIDEPRTYLFHFNECCHSFNVVPADSNYSKMRICFRLMGPVTNHNFLGTLDENGSWVNSATSDTLEDFCRFAMRSSRYVVSLSETRECVENDCLSIYCMYENGDLLSKDYSYEVVSMKFKFMFMPLSNRPVFIYYDPEQDIVRIRP